MPLEQIQNYNRISANVDILISKHGSEKTADIIESIVFSKTTIDCCTIDLQKAILSEVCRQFKVNIKLLETSNAAIYKQARKTCFYLLNKHAKLSHEHIRKKFPKLKHTRGYVANYIQQMKGIIETPNVDKPHHKVHTEIEIKILQLTNENK